MKHPGVIIADSACITEHFKGGLLGIATCSNCGDKFPALVKLEGERETVNGPCPRCGANVAVTADRGDPSWLLATPQRIDTMNRLYLSGVLVNQ